MSAHEHNFTRSKPTATVETCVCGRWRHTEHASPAIEAIDPTTLATERFEFHSIDYKGRAFSGFYAARSPQDGPGWYVFGRNPGYGGSLVMLCARPAVAPRKHPHYNCKVRRGFRTRREASGLAQALNASKAVA